MRLAAQSVGSARAALAPAPARAHLGRARRSVAPPRRESLAARAAAGGEPPRPPTPGTPGGGGNSLSSYRPPSREEASLRAEVEAPFRSLRLVLYGFGVVAAALASAFSLPQLLGALAGAPNAKEVGEAVADVGINAASLAGCALLLKRDWEAREKQIARLLREDNLGACRLELASGRVLRLAQLRGAARPVIFAGSPAQLAAALEAAAPFREALEAAGVLFVGLPLYADGAGAAADGSAAAAAAATGGDGTPRLEAADQRWRATPVRLDDWRAWFVEQTAAAGKAGTTERGFYVGLRLDGRVRASGLGAPPWERFAAQLPPSEGFFGGLLDGMDGKV
jgi:hypothetical protein